MNFEDHQRPNASKLEAHRDEITAMRARNWPCLKIAEWLGQHRKLTIHQESVRRFCLSRNITKGEPKAAEKPGKTSHTVAQHSKKPSPPPSPSPDKKKLFHYDGDDKPIRTRKNR